jgi:hypothetical protein
MPAAVAIVRNRLEQWEERISPHGTIISNQLRNFLSVLVPGRQVQHSQFYLHNERRHSLVKTFFSDDLIHTQQSE